MSKQPFEPWEWYPDIWPTKSKFYTWLRGCLRNAVWNKSPVKITHKNANCDKPPDGYTGRAKSGAYCALSGVWEGKSKLESDHVVGNVSLTDEGDILTFIKHLIPPPGSLQLVTKEAHKIKSYAERQGISYEDAVIRKRVIYLENCEDKMDVLTEHGYTGSQVSNKEKREQCFTKLLEEGKIT
tara:strand:+ start:10729 stop:11277 length:549 start_codon:yes stop_codon:yes gene_type:complete